MTTCSGGKQSVLMGTDDARQLPLRHHTLLEAFAGFGAPFCAALGLLLITSPASRLEWIHAAPRRLGGLLPGRLTKGLREGIAGCLGRLWLLLASVEGLFQASNAEVSGATAPAEQGIAPFRESVASLLTGTRQPNSTMEHPVRWSICSGSNAMQQGPAGLTRLGSQCRRLPQHCEPCHRVSVLRRALIIALVCPDTVADEARVVYGGNTAPGSGEAYHWNVPVMDARAHSNARLLQSYEQQKSMHNPSHVRNNPFRLKHEDPTTHVRGCCRRGWQPCQTLSWPTSPAALLSGRCMSHCTGQ